MTCAPSRLRPGAAGYQLDRVQNGLLPNDWKPMPAVGKGVLEIRIHDEAGAFRVIYVAKLPDAVHVLHSFRRSNSRRSRRT